MENFGLLDLATIIVTVSLVCIAGLTMYQYWEYNRYGGGFQKHYDDDSN